MRILACRATMGLLMAGSAVAVAGCGAGGAHVIGPGVTTSSVPAKRGGSGTTTTLPNLSQLTTPVSGPGSSTTPTTTPALTAANVAAINSQLSELDHSLSTVHGVLAHPNRSDQ